VTQALLVALLALLAPTQAPAADEQAGAFEAAFALKRQQKPAEAAAAFEEFARQYPRSPRIGEARVEAGVGWFAHARAQMVMNRATPKSDEAFAKALRTFGDLIRELPGDPSAGRAQYMLGSTHFFLGDLAAAEADYGGVLANFPKDAKYVPKALERRAAMRRHLLQTDLALQDLQRYAKEHPKGEESQSVSRYIELASMLDKPSPPLKVEAWIQGGPVTPGPPAGKVLGLLFFSTWCDKCEKQQAFLLDLERRYAPAGFVLVGVMNHGHQQTVDSVRTWLAANDIRFPVLMDASQGTASGFRNSSTPDLVLIDRAGRVRWHDNPEVLHDYTMETLLAEEPSPAGSR